MKTRRIDMADAMRKLRALRITCKPEGECAYCDQHCYDEMMPKHEASPRCESGKRPHCTCDICF